MIDFHTHILPSIDDGSKSIEETINLVKEAKEAGFEGIIATPHYIEGYYEVSNTNREKLLESFKNRIEEEKVDIKLYLGSEIYLSENIIKLLKESRVSTINNTRYVLFELPLNEKIINLKDIAFKIISAGFIPVLAHPERYSFVQNNPNVIKDLIRLGVLMQCNFGSFIGQYGKKSQLLAKKFLTNDMVHFLGSDVHRENTIYTQLPKVLIELKKIIKEEKIKEITEINPKAILINNEIEIHEPRDIKYSLKDLFVLNFK